MTSPYGYKVVSLYSGAGGMDYGFKLAGFETIFANDIDPAAVKTFGNLLDNKVAVAGDIKDITLPSHKDLDVVIGGPPCQGFSVAGNMDPNDPRNEHVWKFLKAVSTLEPKVFVMENVKALAVNRRWTGMRDSILSESKAMGYSTYLFVLKASDFGVAQNRERMFLIGSRIGEFFPPLPTSANAPPTSRSVLNSLPAIGQPGNDRLATASITFALKPDLRKSPFAGLLFNGGGRPINLDAPAMTLLASMGGNKTPIVDQLWLEEGGSDHWVKRYHQSLCDGADPLDWKTAPSCLRRLSTQEAAALQSFPVWLEWVGTTTAVFRQIGNAVPPPLAQVVAKNLLDLL